jgi:SAM-dependent methyltransferase
MFGDASAYERFMGRWSAQLAPLFIGFANARDGARILDAGSGTGNLSFALARSLPACRVAGIDPSREYVEFAAARNPAKDRVTFQVGDAQQLQFPGASFDACLSLLVFNFIPDAAKALREVIRVTKPAGLVCAAVWDYGDGMQMLRVFWQAAAAIDPQAVKTDESHMRLCRAGELASLWKQSGLEHVVERPLDFAMHFASLDDFWQPFLLGQGPAGAYVRKLDGDRKRRLRDELKRRLSPNSEYAPFSLPARAWAVRGAVLQS